MAEIGLMDCNNFFASCEQLLNPELRDKPVCIISGENGCVVARSKEAKKLGVKMGMPAFMARKEFPKVLYVNGRLGVYAEISARVMEVLRQFSPKIQIYSIDEAFFDMSGLDKLYNCSLEKVGILIKNAIFEQVGVPVSVGISKSKVLAKLATERAKKSKDAKDANDAVDSIGTEGVYKIDYQDIARELKNTKIIEIWGIGRNTALALNRHGIITASQFISKNNNWIKALFGQRGLELKQELLGNCISPVSNRVEPPQSIQKTRSFEKFSDDYAFLKSTLNYHVHIACSKLRRLEMKTKIFGIMLRTKDFRVVYKKVSLNAPTNCEFVINKEIDNLLGQLYYPGILYRSSGITFENLIQESAEQLSLLEQDKNKAKKEKLSQVWDNLENRFGRNIIKTGICMK